MNPADMVDLAHQTIFVVLKLGAPLMLIGMAIGLLIAFLQALTQIQEMTLTFVPKLVVMLLSLLLLLPMMLSTLSGYMHMLVQRIITG